MPRYIVSDPIGRKLNRKGGKMDYRARIHSLQQILHEERVDGMIVQQQIALQYLTGLHLSAGLLYVPTSGAPELLVDGRYIEMAKQRSPFPASLMTQGGLDEFLAILAGRKHYRLAFDADNTVYSEYQRLTTKLNEIDKRSELVSLRNPVGTIRQIKDEEEIQLLRQAAILGSRGYDFVSSILEEGISEKEVAMHLEFFWKKEGGDRLAFDPIIAFGPNTSMPHYRAGDTRLERDQPVLIDIGVVWKGYHSDMTRTIFFGTPDSQVLEIYDVVKQAQELALELVRPGITAGELDAASRGYITECGFGDLFSHGLGHGVGLEIHEGPSLNSRVPFKDVQLQEGMVITIEPGIYLPGIGGVRIEDTVVVTADGHENLTDRSTEKTHIIRMSK